MMPRAPPGAAAFAAADRVAFVRPEALASRGCDASDAFDEEPDHDDDYSDDEAQAAARAAARKRHRDPPRGAGPPPDAAAADGAPFEGPPRPPGP